MLRPGQALILIVLCLLCLGVVMVSSAGMAIEPVSTSDPSVATGISSSPVVAGLPGMFFSIAFSRSSLYALMALLTMGIVSLLPVHAMSCRLMGGGGGGGDGVGALQGTIQNPHRQYRAQLLAVLGLVLVLSTVYWPVIGVNINGSHRWVRLPVPGIGDVLSVQPSEIAKWAIIPIMAWFAATQGFGIRSFWRGLVPGLACVGIISLVIMVEDLGTAVLIGAVGCIILLAAGAKLRYFLLAAPAALVVLAVAVITSPYRMRRIVGFLDPLADAQGSGYHLLQSIRAVAGGQGFGRGLGHGLQKFGYLPEDTTDFLFAIIAEELGILGVALVIGLYAALLLVSQRIISKETNPLLKLAGLGVMATIGLQATMNMLVVTGMAPTKGIALPLLSSGGTGWILTAASLGALVAIDRQHAREQVRQTRAVILATQQAASENELLDEPEDAEVPEIVIPARTRVPS